VPKGVTRKVQIVVRGATGSKIFIDGGTERQNAQIFELNIGQHTYLVKPPNEECCVAPPVQTFDLVPGDMMYRLFVPVPFKDASLQFAGPEGSEARCPLLGLTFTTGSRKKIRMSTPEMATECQVSPPDTTDGSPKQIKTIDVTLTAGRLSTIPWP
jgi:hypothetical protein